MRIPLPTNLESRDGDLAQDAKIKNGYIDTEETAPNVVKRAGLNLLQITGDGSIPNDIFVLDDVAYVWRESDPSGNPTVTQIYTGANQFADYEFDMDVPTPSLGLSNGAFGDEVSGGSDVRVRFSVLIVNSGGIIIGFGALTVRSADGSISYAESNPIPVSSFSGHVEIKLEDDSYNAYQDSVLIASVENPGPGFSSPTLVEIEVADGTVNNLQFIP
jgi:adhesin HecA-like repeat protein